MRAIFLLLVAANLGLTLAGYLLLPDRIAVHFGAGGMADGWGSNGANTLLMAGIQTLMFGMIYGIPRLVEILPPRWVNLPYRNYWLDPGRRARAAMMIRAPVWRFGVALFLFFLVTGGLALRANLHASAEPARLEMAIFLPSLGVFLAYTVWWVIALYRQFRVP